MGEGRRKARRPEERLAASQFGLITRAEARECGLSERMLNYRIRDGGPWQRVPPGVYLTVTGQPNTDQRLMAALLYAGESSIITGPAAVRHYKISVPETGTVDVLVPAARKRAGCQYVAVHRTRRLPGLYAANGPIWFASPARAVADTALGLAELADVRAVVASAVQRGRCRVEQIEAELFRGPHRGARLLRAALAEVADGVRSPAEADLRTLVAESGLPAPILNARLYVAGALVAVADAWWPQAGVAVEVDSREWHLSPADWERTMHRHAALTSFGVLVLHFSPRQIQDDPAGVVAAIRAALSAGHPIPGITVRSAA
jgi:hypothetical protein